MLEACKYQFTAVLDYVKRSNRHSNILSLFVLRRVQRQPHAEGRCSFPVTKISTAWNPGRMTSTRLAALPHVWRRRFALCGDSKNNMNLVQPGGEMPHEYLNWWTTFRGCWNSRVDKIDMIEWMTTNQRPCEDSNTLRHKTVSSVLGMLTINDRLIVD